MTTAPPRPPNWPEDWPFDPASGSRFARSGMVTSTDRYASEVGLALLRSGGNAVDAGVGVCFALAVVNPEAGNVGGGGFLLLRSADGEEAALDYRSTAPRAATASMYAEGARGEEAPSVLGALAASTPGSVAGLWEAHRRYGNLPWSAVVDPSVGLARGFVVGERFLDSFEPHIVRGLGRFPESRRIFLPGGSPPLLGSTFRQPELAETLERIRDRGRDGFYTGRTADLLVDEMHRSGGIIDHEDLRSYEPVWREPIRYRHGSHQILSMPPSSSGGITLALASSMLAGMDLGSAEWHSPEHLHLLIEAWRRAFADRNHHLADPGFVEVPTAALTDPAYGARLARTIDRERATPSSAVRAGSPDPAPDGAHTTHVSVVDREGNAVSITTTVNTWYGSKLTVRGAGFLLNNEMDDFTTNPGEPNFFGLVQGPANAIEPGKRSLSAMTPTIVLDAEGRLRLVVGTPGGATIITTVFQVVSGILDHGLSLGAAVCAPRLHHQHLPDQVDFEPGGLTDGVRAALEERGHLLRPRQEWSGDVQAVAVAPDGLLEGYSDPRRGGVPAGW